MSFDEYYNDYLNDGMSEEEADQMASLDCMIDGEPEEDDFDYDFVIDVIHCNSCGEEAELTDDSTGYCEECGSADVHLI